MKFLKFFVYFILVLVLLAILFIFLTDNPTREYFNSKFIYKADTEQICKKSKSIGFDELKNGVLNQPNSEFYFFTYYCSPCRKSLTNGSSFDSLNNRNITYISIDNISTISKICELVEANDKIKSFYFISDSSINGVHFSRGQQIYNRLNFNKVLPYIAYPYKVITDEKGKVVSASIGY